MPAILQSLKLSEAPFANRPPHLSYNNYFAHASKFYRQIPSCKEKLPTRAATLAGAAVDHPSHPSPSPLPEEAAESPAWFPRTATAGTSPCIREPFCAGSAPGSGGCVALVLRGVVSSATGSTWCGRAAAAGAPNPVFIFSDGSGERPYSSSPATSDSRWGRWKALY